MIISRTPFRISFVGGATDFKEVYQHFPGSVISTAIDKYIYVTVNKKFTEHIRVSYSKTELVEHIHEVEHNLVREALKLLGIHKCIDITYMSDLLPDKEGSGLGASSSLLVGTLNALHAFKGEHVSAEQLAREAYAIEAEILKHPVGKQDQYAAAYGGFNHMQFNPDESVFVNPILLSAQTKELLNKRILLFYTGIKKRSDEILTEQKQNTALNLETLKLMARQTHGLLDELRKGNVDSLGEFLHQGWLLKKTLASKITNPLIDEYYERALRAGARGGKVAGSGGGGFLLLYCPEERAENVRAALKELREAHFKFEPEGSKIIYVHKNSEND